MVIRWFMEVDSIFLEHRLKHIVGEGKFSLLGSLFRLTQSLHSRLLHRVKENVRDELLCCQRNQSDNSRISFSNPSFIHVVHCHRIRNCWNEIVQTINKLVEVRSGRRLLNIINNLLLCHCQRFLNGLPHILN